MMINKYLVYWFDNKLWRDLSFIVLSETENDVLDWVMENYEPRGSRPSINIEMRAGSLKLPIIVPE